MAVIIVVVCILLLILLITWGHINPFLAFLVVSLTAGLLLGIAPGKVAGSVQRGIGDTMGSLTIIIALGAMLGKLVAASGAAQRIAAVLMDTFGKGYVQWALMATGFIVGIPLFYGVGFVLLVPLLFSVIYRYNLPAVYTGLPMLAALSVTHGFLPPHPSPMALVVQFRANAGVTLLYGLMIAIPAILIAGPLFSLTLKKIRVAPLAVFQPALLEEERLPATGNSFVSALLPVFLLLSAAAIQYCCGDYYPRAHAIAAFAGDPAIVMLASLLVATFSLGIARGRRMKEVMGYYTEAIKEVGMILLIIAGAGALKQVLTDSGVSGQIATLLQASPVPPLVLGWLIAALVRLCVGSATVAGLTAAGIVVPLVERLHVNPNLMVLSVGAGSLMFSHVNDAGFWMFKEYFNCSIKDTFRSWSLMETIVGLVGLAGVLALNHWI